jgi:hypothetical protein
MASIAGPARPSEVAKIIGARRQVVAMAMAVMRGKKQLRLVHHGLYVLPGDATGHRPIPSQNGFVCLFCGKERAVIDGFSAIVCDQTNLG